MSIAPISSTYSPFSSFMQQRDWKSMAMPKKVPAPFQNLSIMQTMPWLHDKSLASALIELKELKFESDDVKYLKNLGVNVPFKSGEEAVKFIEKQNIRIIFDKPSEPDIHAQYDFGKNIITINEKYRDSSDLPVILAIAEAILHETGHAKDNDGDSSLQEELDCLGMNAVAHRAFLNKYSDVFLNANEPIICDGVDVYAKLFFEPDPDKKNLVLRMKDKYGDLPSGDRVHPPSVLARTITKSV